MIDISKAEYEKRTSRFLSKNKRNFSKKELAYIAEEFKKRLTSSEVPMPMIQIFDEIGVPSEEKNIYDGFIEILQNRFDINQPMIEVGGGRLPYLAKKIALAQHQGTITVYDPQLIRPTIKPRNLKLKKRYFNQKTPQRGNNLIISFMSCDVIPSVIDYACNHDMDFMLALCEGGMKSGFEWLENDDEWISFVKHYAEIKMANKHLGTVGEESLAEYGDKFPIIYSKRKKS